MHVHATKFDGDGETNETEETDGETNKAVEKWSAKGLREGNGE